MQPWHFVVVENKEKRERVREAFLLERREAAELFDPEKKEKYLSYKLEGILEAPVNLIVTCDSSRSGPQVLGRRSMPETDVYSTCCAIQNLWLAARAENLGVGWVSIVKREDLHAIFNIPFEIKIVAYLCLGYVTHFPDKPDLETLKWAERIPLDRLVSYDSWNGKPPKEREDLPPLLKLLGDQP
jgi:5,6-dimethylbenzimidazole synthase